MNLTVIVPPPKPVILDGTTRNISGLEQRYNEGSDVNLICEVQGGRPPPKLTWYLENTVIDESYHYKPESRLTVNHLSYPKVGRQHLKARLICEASNTNLVPPKTILVILDVNRNQREIQRARSVDKRFKAIFSAGSRGSHLTCCFDRPPCPGLSALSTIAVKQFSTTISRSPGQRAGPVYRTPFHVVLLGQGVHALNLLVVHPRLASEDNSNASRKTDQWIACRLPSTWLRSRVHTHSSWRARPRLVDNGDEKSRAYSSPGSKCGLEGCTDGRTRDCTPQPRVPLLAGMSRSGMKLKDHLGLLIEEERTSVGMGVLANSSLLAWYRFPKIIVWKAIPITRSHHEEVATHRDPTCALVAQPAGATCIKVKPLVVQILTKEPRVSAGKNYDVECRTSGSRPEAEITWWKGIKQIKKMVQNYALENNQSLSILSFVPSIDDDGQYLTCRAVNPAIPLSALEDNWRLDVQYQPVVTLKMGKTLNPDDIKEGDDVYFECSVRANPKVHKLAWFKDGKELKNNATAGIVLSDHSLVLQRITRYSAGDYTCLVANSEGKTASNPVTLQIMYTPVCKEGKSEVVVGALKQETVSLVCSVESHPAPLIFHWTFNNSGELVEVPHSRYSHAAAVGTPSVAESLKEYQQFHGSRLNYTPATEMDYGTVACWASNQVGKQRTPCLFQVIAAGRPYALHNCSTTEMSAPLDAEELTAKSGTGLIVRCLEGYDGGLPISGYQLEVVADEDGGPILLNKTVQASPGGPTFEVAGLTTGRSYRLFLYAINAKGRSEPAILEPVTLKGVAMYTTGAGARRSVQASSVHTAQKGPRNG
ncbi:Myelin-associated glycoprotein [Eufriesea mexicana]|uniref:Myelin-associated glycoprotein n=1 Tax=Eufriesea mexicana TaxID=516756 RepID=A0A310SHP9_9HYME|nr:Myelin-associated glycoprotein [Eufriesea mexicana]